VAEVGRLTTERVLSVLRSSTGLAYSVAALAQTQRIQIQPLAAGQIIPLNAAVDLIEKADIARYPSVYVYCEKFTNQLKEKFRTFSGKAQMAIEARVTSDRLDELDRQLQLYTGAVAQMLERQRGDWGNGMYYAGGYEIAFAGAKRGGRSYVQTAKATFEVEISIS